MVIGIALLLGVVHGVAATGDSGPVQGLEPLASLAGEWEVSGTMLDPEGNPVEIRSAATILHTLNGLSIEERSSYYPPPHAVDFVCIRSWDEFRKEYRMACIDSLTGLLDIYEGRFVAGRLVMTNLDTGTYAEANGVRMWGRQTVSEICENSFQLTWEYSLDEGSTWLEFGRLSYQRRGTGPSADPSSERPTRKIEQ
jgi:hypothetical protein